MKKYKESHLGDYTIFLTDGEYVASSPNDSCKIISPSLTKVAYIAARRYARRLYNED